MTTLRFSLNIFLSIFRDADVEAKAEGRLPPDYIPPLTPFPTGNAELNDIVRNELGNPKVYQTDGLARTQISNIILSMCDNEIQGNSLELLYEGFNKDDDKYNVVVKSRDNISITPQYLSDLINCINQWASPQRIRGLTGIIDPEELLYEGYQQLDLVVQVDRVYIINESQIDLPRLPPPTPVLSDF